MVVVEIVVYSISGLGNMHCSFVEWFGYMCILVHGCGVTVLIESDLDAYPIAVIVCLL